MSAVDNFLSGYELDKCTNDENIISHLKGIVTAHKLMPIDNPYKIIQIHKSFNPSCLDKGKPGEIRMEKGYSKTSGNDYASPELIIPYLSKIHNQSNNYVKHILYEWIHPFYDGNGRSGRIILLIDSDYDFDRVLNFCGDKYIDYIINYIDHFKDINKILHV
jgi:Fic family protein